MSNNKDKGKKRKPDPKYDKREKLVEAIERVYNLQQMCKLQLELGYDRITMAYPSKHHINRILSLQYYDYDVIEVMYGKKLVEQAFELIPACKSYINFTKESSDEPVETKKQAKTSGFSKTSNGKRRSGDSKR